MPTTDIVNMIVSKAPTETAHYFAYTFWAYREPMLT